LKRSTSIGLWSVGTVVMEDGIAFAAMVYLAAVWVMTVLVIPLSDLFRS